MFATSDSGPLFFQLAVSAKRGKRGFEVLTAAMSASRITSNLLVGIVGLEPTRPLGHQILSLTRLPIPSYPHKCGFQAWFRKPDHLRISRACTPSSAASLDNSHFRLGRCHHITRVFISAPLRAVCPSWRTPASVFLVHTQPARFSFRTLVIVQVQG